MLPFVGDRRMLWRKTVRIEHTSGFETAERF
jgi:hypothetical protein